MNNVLIVVDAQNDFIDGPLGTPEAQAAVPKIVEKIKDSGEETLILFTKDTHEENYLDTQEGRILPIKHCINGTDGWRIHKEIRDAWLSKVGTIILNEPENNNTFCKNQFGSGELMYFLRMIESDFDEIQLVGFCTDICVITNALLIKTFFPEIPVSIDSSCCAGTMPEYHQKALDVMKSCQIDVK